MFASLERRVVALRVRFEQRSQNLGDRGESRKFSRPFVQTRHESEPPESPAIALK